MPSIDSKVPVGIGYVSFRGYPKIPWTLWGHWGGNPRFQTIPPSHSRMTPKVSAMRRPQSLPPWQVRHYDRVQEPLMMVISMKVMLMIFMIVDVDCFMIDGCLTNISMIVIFFAGFSGTCHTWWEIFRWTAAFNFWWHVFFWQCKTIKNETCGDQLQAMESQRTCKPDMNKG